MGESFGTRMARWGFNWFPAYRGMGARVLYIASDWRKVRVRVRLSWRTRNYVGTIYGGSLYGAIDPMYMVMLMKLLGPAYEVWDKAARIRFRRPGRGTLYATFRIPEAETDRIVEILQTEKKTDRHYKVRLVDLHGEVYASFVKTVHVRRKDRTAREKDQASLNGEV